MGDVPLSDLPATTIFTRIGVMTAQLGIDGFQLESSRKQLTPAVNEYARVWLDADARRMALRTTVDRPPMLTRPGVTYLEVETNPDAERPDGTLLVVGSRPLHDDLRLLAEGVDAAVLAAFERRVRLLEVPDVAILAQRPAPGGLQWFVSFALGAQSTRQVSLLAESLDVEPYQRTMLGALHGDLATKGCIVTVSCTRASIRSDVTIQYLDIAWDQVVTTTSQLRATKSGGAFGVMAGAFAAERAAFFEVTFRDDRSARTRAAIEYIGGRL